MFNGCYNARLINVSFGTKTRYYDGGTKLSVLALRYNQLDLGGDVRGDIRILARLVFTRQDLTSKTVSSIIFVRSMLSFAYLDLNGDLYGIKYCYANLE